MCGITPLTRQTTIQEALKSIRAEEQVPTRPVRPNPFEKLLPGEQPQSTPKGRPRVMIRDPYPYLRPDYPFWMHYQDTPFPAQIPEYYQEFPLP